MSETTLKSYLYELKPYVNTAEWKKASGEIKGILKSNDVSYEDWKSTRNQYIATKKEVKSTENLIKRVEERVKTAQGKELEMYQKLLGRKAYETTSKSGKKIMHAGTGLYGELDTLKKQAEMQGSNVELAGLGVSKGSKVAAGVTKFASSITAAAGSVMAFVGGLKKAFDAAMKLANSAIDMSNKLNTGGAFSNMSIRNMQARYGVSSTRANAMSIALNQMGLSESDLGRMNQAQRKAYDELIAYYEDGINKLDPDKLKEYHEAMEEFQMSVAKWKIGIQNAILKLFVNSEAFKKLTGKLGDFMEKVVEFLETPVVQWFFDTFIEFLSAIMDFINGAMDTINWVLGGDGSGSSTTNNTSNSTNTYYIYGSDYSSNDELARSIALKQQSGGIG